VLFFTELWERLAYYGLRSLLVLYLVDSAGGGLGWSPERASRFYGWFVGLTYLSPVFGGWMADRFLGSNRAITVGGIVLSLGYLLLALARYGSFLAGIALIILGTGFMKPTMHTMVGQLYGASDPRRDSGFTLYYMGINVGAFLGPLLCAWLAARYGWPFGFAGAFAAMAIGLGVYLATRRDRLRDVGSPPAPLLRDRSANAQRAPALSRGERRRLAAIALSTIFVVGFWIAYEQSGSSLNLFAAHRVDREAGGLLGALLPRGEIPAPWFQAVNPLCILILAPLIATLWQRLGPRAPSSPAKMALGLLLLALAYGVMVLGAARSGRGALVSPWLLITFYGIYSLGELCFLPVGISFVSRTAPLRLASMVMGLWLTANFVANLAGGYLAGMMEQIQQGALFRVLGGEADFFLIFVVLCAGTGLALWMLVPFLNRLTGAVKAADA
jgi:POT family proton-dependent oligopeptide transporter